ncbi:MAG: hypothetical protein NVS4B3_17860 [Gemmatimonadaceae bacterium]
MTFRFVYDPLEYYRATRVAQRLARRIPTWPYVVVFLVGTAGILQRGRVGVGEPGQNVAAMIWLAALFLVPVGLIPLLTLYRAYRLPKRDPALAAPLERTLTDRRLELRGAGVRADLDWPHFRRGVETGEFFLLLPHIGGAYYLPKRALANDAEVRVARSILATHLGNRFAALGPR